MISKDCNGVRYHNAGIDINIVINIVIDMFVRRSYLFMFAKRFVYLDHLGLIYDIRYTLYIIYCTLCNILY